MKKIFALIFVVMIVASLAVACIVPASASETVIDDSIIYPQRAAEFYSLLTDLYAGTGFGVPSLATYFDMLLIAHQNQGYSEDVAKWFLLTQNGFTVSREVDLNNAYFPLYDDFDRFIAQETVNASIVIDGDVYYCFLNQLYVDFTLDGFAVIDIILTDVYGRPTGQRLEFMGFIRENYSGIINEPNGSFSFVDLRAVNADGSEYTVKSYGSEAVVYITISDVLGGDNMGLVNFLALVFGGPSDIDDFNGFSLVDQFAGYLMATEEGGLVPPASSDAYDRGYNDAIRDIDSGEFGRNILGGVLSAPFQLLRDFTLVSWSVGGSVVVITLADLVSAVIGVGLFVWFLKIFAGG